MSFFAVDADLCLQDDACAAESLSYLIKMHDGAWPTPIARAEETCVN